MEKSAKKLYFIDKIDRKYGAGAGNIFLLHGNIHDLFPAPDGAWRPLLPLLCSAFSREKRIFVQIDLAEGFTVLPVWPNSPDELPEKELSACSGLSAVETAERLEKRTEQMRQENRERQKDFLRNLLGSLPADTAAGERRGIFGRKSETSLFDFLEQESILSSFAALTLAREILEKMRRTADANGYKIIFFINDLGSLAPNQNEGQQSENDRRNIQVLQKWFNETEFLSSRHAVIMTGGSLEGISPKIRELPQVVPIKIRRPDTDERRALIADYLDRHADSLRIADGLDLDGLAAATAGMALRDIDQMLRTIRFAAESDPTRHGIIALADIRIRAREVLEQSAGGYIEFIEPDHGLDSVLGQKKLVPVFVRLARAFRQGNGRAIPSGILISGPNGSGKSFVLQGFTKETGRHTIRLKNIRNMYYGQTEAIWEKIEEIIEAIGWINIMVDEGDTELGGRGQNVHEVDKRLFGKILRMMEDKKNKGRVCWIIITARPDKLEPDIKRSGRAGLHIPIFPPETEEERFDFLKILLTKRFGLNAKMSGGLKKELLSFVKYYYPADFDLLLEQLEILRLDADSGDLKIGWEHVRDELRCLRPADPVLQRRLQVYLALLECTDIRLVPDNYRSLLDDREKLVAMILELKNQLRE